MTVGERIQRDSKESNGELCDAMCDGCLGLPDACASGLVD
jgi:hypothetical protein